VFSEATDLKSKLKYKNKRTLTAKAFHWL